MFSVNPTAKPRETKSFPKSSFLSIKFHIPSQKQLAIRPTSVEDYGKNPILWWIKNQTEKYPRGGASNAKSHTSKLVCLTDSDGSQYLPKLPKEKLQIATYNIRTMRTQEHLTELEQIKWDLLGMYGMRLPGENCRALQSGHALHSRNLDQDTSWRNSHSHWQEKKTIGHKILLHLQPCYIYDYEAIQKVHHTYYSTLWGHHNY